MVKVPWNTAIPVIMIMPASRLASRPAENVRLNASDRRASNRTTTAMASKLSATSGIISRKPLTAGMV